MRYAVIPTHNRPSELLQLTAQLRAQADVIVVVDNASDPPVTVADLLFDGSVPTRVHTARVIRDEEQPPNLYRLWNVAFDAVDAHAQAYELEEWDVAVFNDDSSVPQGWYDTVVSGLRSLDVVAASTTTHIPIRQPWISHSPGEGGLMYRLCPWGFVFRGERKPRADESMRWWWGDTDFDWEFRRNGGIALVPGPIVVNTHANGQTHGELMEQAGRDRGTFAAKWGGNPW